MRAARSIEGGSSWESSHKPDSIVVHDKAKLGLGAAQFVYVKVALQIQLAAVGQNLFNCVNVRGTTKV
jgi:hypothetical protein